MPNSIKRELNDGMIRELRKRSLTLEIRYYSLTLGSDFSGMESCGVNGTTRNPLIHDVFFVTMFKNVTK